MLRTNGSDSDGLERPSYVIRFLAGVVLLIGTATLCPAEDRADDLYAAFQHPGGDAKPFVYWWWWGNDVTRAEITRQLDLLHDAGVGGVHMMPLGPSTGNLKWLSPEWWRLARYASDEAKRRDMGMDITAGYGWPSGGPFVRPEHRLQAISCFSEELHGPLKFEKPLDDFLAMNLVGDHSLEFGRKFMAETLHGKRSLAFMRLVPKRLDRLDQVIDLSGQVRDGTMSFSVPAGDYILYVGIHRSEARSNKLSGEQAFSVDYFNKEGVRTFFDHFGKTYSDAIGGRLGDSFHAVFLSSVEIWPANWTTGFTEEFRRRRGYDLMPYAEFALGMYPILYHKCITVRPDLFTASPALADKIRRVRYDYNKTLVELFGENFAETIHAWCREQGTLFRFQSNGYPWNIGMCEYSMVQDIPEGNNWIHENRQGNEGWEAWNKTTAAGAHLTGKHLISCEAMTTQYGKFHETLDIVKRADDLNFVTGITRSVVHGFCYSPATAPPPGWGKYGTYLSEHNPWWPYFGYWTQRNARLSQVMQMGDPVVDAAILCPMADVWSDFGMNHYMTVTRPRWAYKLWESLSQQGVSADYLHERVIQKARFEEGRLIYGPMSYKVLILCDVQSLEPETAEAIERFVAAGGKLVIIGKQPERSPGLADSAAQDRRVKVAIKTAIAEGGERVTWFAAPPDDMVGPLADLPEKPVDPAIRSDGLLRWTGQILNRARVGRQMVIFNPSPKLFQVQYRYRDRDILFLCNQDTNRNTVGNVEFRAGREKTAWRWDPETGNRAIYPCKEQGQYSLDVAPCESLLLVFEPNMSEGTKYVPPPVADGPSLTITTAWNLKLRSFRGEESVLQGQPLADFAHVPSLNKFAGVIDYETTFEVHAAKLTSRKVLDLGKINGVSEAWLNGQSLGVRWYGAHEYPTSGLLKAGANELRVKVTTLLFNGVGSEKEPRESTGMPGPVLLRECRKP